MAWDTTKVPGDLISSSDYNAGVSDQKARTPGGTSTNLQYNDAGIFGGSVNMNWLKTRQNLDLTGSSKTRGKADYSATGTISYVNSSLVVNGSGTAFLSEVKVGDYVWNKSTYATWASAVSAGMYTRVQAVNSDTQLQLRNNYFTASAGGSTLGIAPCLINFSDYNDANANVSGEQWSGYGCGFNGIYVDFLGNTYIGNSLNMNNGKGVNFTGNGTIQSITNGATFTFRTTDGASNYDFKITPAGTKVKFNVSPNQVNYETHLIGGWDNAGASAPDYDFVVTGGDAGESSNRGANSITLRGGNSRGTNTTGGHVKIKTGEVGASGTTLQTYYDRAHFYQASLVFNEDGRDYDIRMEGDTDPNLFVLDAGLDKITLGKTSLKEVPRVVTTTDDATAEIDVTATDVYELSAIANNTTFTLTGTAIDGQKIMIRLKDAGVSKTLTWTGFTAIGVTLPTATTASKWHYIGITYNSSASAWHAIAVGEEA